MNQRTNKEWLEALGGPASEEALTDLRELLLRGLRASLAAQVREDLDALTEDFTQEALVKILGSLDSFRGESKFTTWAQKIAIHVAFTELRRRRWKDISLQDLIETAEGEEYTPSLLADPAASPEQEATRRAMWELVNQLIEEELTERQRTALLAVIGSNAPLDEVAKRLDTNRNALYKLIHDARKRLQQRLEEKAGLSASEVLALFEEK